MYVLNENRIKLEFYKFVSLNLIKVAPCANISERSETLYVVVVLSGEIALASRD